MERSHREPVNGWLHFGGAVLALAGLAVLVLEARGQRSLRHLAAAVSFGGTSTLLFGASALYHLRPASRRASLYRRLDHAMIYVFIAGTYTAVCLVPLWDAAAGRVLLALVWLLALAGVVVEALPVRPPRGVATALYLALGWIGLVAGPTFVRQAPPGMLRWLFVGGVLYTAGAIVYWQKWPRGRPGLFGFHELWHACVVLGCASHYWAVLGFVR
ncbi:MAG TPA: hemolysin III family protein [Gemmatimonadaceae bacterium]|nr:hemolysin III family protein [Gemmatimonadaceae bacterium]